MTPHPSDPVETEPIKKKDAALPQLPELGEDQKKQETKPENADEEPKKNGEEGEKKEESVLDVGVDAKDEEEVKEEEVVRDEGQATEQGEPEDKLDTDDLKGQNPKTNRVKDVRFDTEKEIKGQRSGENVQEAEEKRRKSEELTAQMEEMGFGPEAQKRAKEWSDSIDDGRLNYEKLIPRERMQGWGRALIGFASKGATAASDAIDAGTKSLGALRRLTRSFLSPNPMSFPSALASEAMTGFGIMYDLMDKEGENLGLKQGADRSIAMEVPKLASYYRDRDRAEKVSRYVIQQYNDLLQDVVGPDGDVTQIGFEQWNAVREKMGEMLDPEIDRIEKKVLNGGKPSMEDKAILNAYKTLNKDYAGKEQNYKRRLRFATQGISDKDIEQPSWDETRKRYEANPKRYENQLMLMNILGDQITDNMKDDKITPYYIKEAHNRVNLRIDELKKEVTRQNALKRKARETLEHAQEVERTNPTVGWSLRDDAKKLEEEAAKIPDSVKEELELNKRYLKRLDALKAKSSKRMLSPNEKTKQEGYNKIRAIRSKGARMQHVPELIVLNTLGNDEYFGFVNGLPTVNQYKRALAEAESRYRNAKTPEDARIYGLYVKNLKGILNIRDEGKSEESTETVTTQNDGDAVPVNADDEQNPGEEVVVTEPEMDSSTNAEEEPIVEEDVDDVEIDDSLNDSEIDDESIPEELEDESVDDEPDIGDDDVQIDETDDSPIFEADEEQRVTSLVNHMANQYSDLKARIPDMSSDELESLWSDLNELSGKYKGIRDSLPEMGEDRIRRTKKAVASARWNNAWDRFNAADKTGEDYRDIVVDAINKAYDYYQFVRDTHSGNTRAIRNLEKELGNIDNPKVKESKQDTSKKKAESKPKADVHQKVSDIRNLRAVDKNIEKDIDKLLEDPNLSTDEKSVLAKKKDEIIASGGVDGYNLFNDENSGILVANNVAKGLLNTPNDLSPEQWKEVVDRGFNKDILNKVSSMDFNRMTEENKEKVRDYFRNFASLYKDNASKMGLNDPYPFIALGMTDDMGKFLTPQSFIEHHDTDPTSSVTKGIGDLVGRMYDHTHPNAPLENRSELYSKKGLINILKMDGMQPIAAFVYDAVKAAESNPKTKEKMIHLPSSNDIEKLLPKTETVTEKEDEKKKSSKGKGKNPTKKQSSAGKKTTVKKWGYVEANKAKKAFDAIYHSSKYSDPTVDVNSLNDYKDGLENLKYGYANGKFDKDPNFKEKVRDMFERLSQIEVNNKELQSEINGIRNFLKGLEDE